jgi:G3E family GTPase
MARSRAAPIPLTVVVGPLGAGKTSLINRVLLHPGFADSAVILNEFGATRLDGGRVERAEDGIVSLGSGCICCTVRGALVDAFERILRGLDNGRLGAVSRMIVEADAAADPAAIVATVARHPYLSLRIRPDGIVAVVRGAGAAAALAASAATARQVAAADVVAVSGTDAAGVDALRPLLALNPAAAIVDGATVPPAALVGHGRFDPATGEPEVRAVATDSAPPDFGRSGEAARINAFTVVRQRPVPAVVLDLFLDYLAALQGPNLIRVRGVVAVEEGSAVAVDGIGASFSPPVLYQPAPGQATQTQLAVVARDLDAATFSGYLDAFMNEPRVDTPDRAALADNPLAVTGFSARAGR